MKLKMHWVFGNEIRGFLANRMKPIDLRQPLVDIWHVWRFAKQFQLAGFWDGLIQEAWGPVQVQLLVRADLGDFKGEA